LTRDQKVEKEKLRRVDGEIEIHDKGDIGKGKEERQLQIGRTSADVAVIFKCFAKELNL